MSLKALFHRFDHMAFGFLLGVLATIVTVSVYHEVRGIARLNVWERSFRDRHMERLARLLDEELAVAMEALEQDAPLALNHHLAHRHTRGLYEHHMAYALDLLSSAKVADFNQLRESTGFLIFDFSGRDLSGLDLQEADLGSAVLRETDLSGANLANAVFTLAELSGATLTGADLSGASFAQANMASATLNKVRGDAPDFRQAVLAGASMTQVSELEGALFEQAVLDGINLWGSALPGAHLDHAEMIMASAVDADLSEVAAMTGAVLTGANLAQARINPAAMERTWIVNTEGLDAQTLETLERNGAVSDPEDVIKLVDEEIVAGFRQQIRADPAIPPMRRRGVLLEMAQRYYQR